MATRRKVNPHSIATNGGPPHRELREFQFLIQPVLLLMEDGQTPRPVPAEPRTLTGLDELRAFVEAFPAELENINREL